MTCRIFSISPLCAETWLTVSVALFQHFGQVMDGDGCFADDSRTGLDLLVGALCRCGGAGGEARHLVHRRGHLIDRRGHLLGLGRLMLDLLIAVRRRGAQLARSDTDAVGGSAHLGNDCGEAAGHLGGRPHDAVRVRGDDYLAEIAIGQVADHAGHLVRLGAEGRAQLADDYDGNGHPEQNRHASHRDDEREEAAGGFPDHGHVLIDARFLVIDECIDQSQPFGIGPGDIVQ